MQRTLKQNGNFSNGARIRALPINGLQAKYKLAEDGVARIAATKYDDASLCMRKLKPGN
jgi:hypothetical protein